MNMVEQMERIIESMRPQFQAIRWEDDEVYAQWLSQVYYIARRSTSFLGLCLFHSDKYPDFQKRCTAHIAEETGHEKLIENDMKHLGQKFQPEMATAMAVYQTQYFRIVSENPLSFMGYVFFLELLAPAFGSYIMNRVGNKKSLSFLKVHTSADEDHIQSAIEIQKTMTEEQQKMAMTNFLMTAESYSQMLKQIAGQATSLEEAA